MVTMAVNTVQLQLQHLLVTTNVYDSLEIDSFFFRLMLALPKEHRVMHYTSNVHKEIRMTMYEVLCSCNREYVFHDDIKRRMTFYACLSLALVVHLGSYL